MSDICFYSGLPYTCNLCPENSAPCFFMSELRKQKRIMFLNLKRVWVCNDNELFFLTRIPDYGKKLMCNHPVPRSTFDLNHKKVSLDIFPIIKLLQLCKD